MHEAFSILFVYTPHKKTHNGWLRTNGLDTINDTWIAPTKSSTTLQTCQFPRYRHNSVQIVPTRRDKGKNKKGWDFSGDVMSQWWTSACLHKKSSERSSLVNHQLWNSAFTYIIFQHWQGTVVEKTTTSWSMDWGISQPNKNCHLEVKKLPWKNDAASFGPKSCKEERSSCHVGAM